LKFDFSAADAICCWATKHTKPDLEILEVPYAKDWSSDNSGMKQHKWDWTYSSDYNCTITQCSETQEAEAAAVNLIIAEGRIDGSSLSSAEPTVPPSTEPIILHESDTSGINLDLLRAQDDILFFDDYILYQVSHSL
jgi:hypothetical protein